MDRARPDYAPTPADIEAAVRASVMPSPSDPNYMSAVAPPRASVAAAPQTGRGALQRALSGLPGNASQTIAGGPGSNLPAELGVADLVPFAGGAAMLDDWQANPDLINSVGLAMTAMGLPGIAAKGSKRALRAGAKAADNLLQPSLVDDIGRQMGGAKMSEADIARHLSRSPKMSKKQREAYTKLLARGPEFKSVGRYLKPDEKQGLTERTALQIVDLVKGMPSAEEMADVAIAGSAKRG